MAQFFTNFSDQTVGSSAPTGFTPRWDANTARWSVVAGPAASYGEDVAAAYDLLSWDTPGDVSGQIEVYAEFETSSGAGGQGGVALQSSTSATSGYYAALAFGDETFSEVEVSRLDAGTWNNLGSAAFTWVTNTVYSIRLRKGSDNIVRVRVWATSGSEPGTWNFSSTSDTTYSSGVVGLFARNGNGRKIWRKFGVGTAGDAAPTAPVGGGGDTLVVVGNPQRNRRTSGRRM